MRCHLLISSAYRRDEPRDARPVLSGRAAALRKTIGLKPLFFTMAFAHIALRRLHRHELHPDE
jgi:hypothetical protein